MSPDVRVVYEHLVRVVIPAGRVITYGELSQATGVPLGPPEQNPLVNALYEIFKFCDERRLPPLSSIVVQEPGLYDPTRRHGMPGGGYLVAEVGSDNLAGRRRDPGFEAWAKSPRPPDTDTWEMRDMIEAHQDSVWDYRGDWPTLLEEATGNSLWQTLNITDKVVAILADVPDAEPGHHLGRPFLTAYQIAIEFARRYPEAVAEIGFPLGGLGAGRRNTLAQYLASGLSRKIKGEHLPGIEGGFLSNWHLQDISFEVGGEVIHSSLTGTDFTLSMFRLRE
jgi:hypothetical protein